MSKLYRPAAESALQRSETGQVDYVVRRNEAAIDELTRNSNRPAVDPAPDDLVNAYVDAVLQPVIEGQKDFTADDAAALRQWAEDARAEIVACEKSSPPRSRSRNTRPEGPPP